MIQSKRINIIVSIVLVFALITSIALVVIGNIYNDGSVKTETEYATKIFGEDIISIEIIADEADWQEMLDNAISEQYIMVDVVVNGTKFQNVGIRPKGNSSLTQVANSNSDRYSFRLQFDEYIKDQTCFGLDGFVINNMIGDNTYMKEYVSYELMQEIDVDAPCFGFADIKINGQRWGFYLAVETYGDSYESRTFGTTKGMMYNVKSMDMGGNNEDGNNFDSPQENKKPSTNQNYGRQMDRPNGNFGDPAGGRGSNGGSLEYSTDEVSSYSAIFNNVVGKGDEYDFKRVITALEALSKGENLENYFDVDQILRYLAAHTIVVNLDSYSSSMAQNYYLYENDGKVTILPWDYNLSWGGFQSENASSVINFPIDSPVSGVEMSSRPLLEKLFSNTEYLEKYHDYLQELMISYFSDGKWEEKITQLDEIISDYVKNDNTAFCTFEEYKTAVEVFKTLGNLRYQSIQGQLDGTVPSTTVEQTANSDKLISADNISLSSLGSMMGGGKPGENMGGSPTNWNNQQDNENFNPDQIENMPNPDGNFPDKDMPNSNGNPFDGKMQNSFDNNTKIPTNKGDISQPFKEQTTSVSTNENLLIYSSLFVFVLVLTFFVSRTKRNY